MRAHRFVIALCLSGLFCHSVLADKHDDALTEVVSQRSEADQQRDTYRNPIQTLTFFQVTPGMTLAEVLPGGGWYTRVLAPYLGSDGTLYGVNYTDDTWPLFGFMDENAIARRIASTKAYPELVASVTDSGISSKGFTFSTVPSTAEGTVDRVLFIRALHNLSRFEDQAGLLDEALQATHKLLKKDGLVGVVQHRAPASASSEWAAGNRGYMKQDEVIATFARAGFDLVASSEINANPKDQPGKEDRVWRLPPTLAGSADNPKQKAAMETIGESDRMTLLFKKTPATR